MRHKILLLCSLMLSALIANAQVKHIQIDPSKTHQTIDHFTASDAWSGNFVGKYWDLTPKEQIAEWLFSQSLDDTGSPKGIGLSMWRVNLGAGTLEQDSADIMPFQRRSESFLTKDGQAYDWTKSAGQQYFMQKAVEYGTNNFLLFSNSPPVQYTKNGRGWSDHRGSANITPEGYQQFAKYLTNVADHFINTKAWNIRYLSPFNEPQVDWTNPRQEGSPWRNSEMKKLILHLDQELTDRKLENVRIAIPESASLEWLYDENKNPALHTQYGNDGPYHQIKTFFDPKSPNYVGNLKHIEHGIGAHDYGTQKTNTLIKETREKVKELAEEFKLEYHMTEWCMLPGLKLPIDGFTDDWKPDNHTDIQIALLMARLIHGNMVYADATGWGYWKGMEINGDHALISLFPKDGDITKSGAIRSNKLLWTLGNFSHFIRPGYTRIDAKGAENLDSVVASAYLSPDKSRLVLVVVNSSFETTPYKIDFPQAFAEKIRKVSMFRTDKQTDLSNLHIEEHYKPESEFRIAPRSVNTIVFDSL